MRWFIQKILGQVPPAVLPAVPSLPSEAATPEGVLMVSALEDGSSSAAAGAGAGAPLDDVYVLAATTQHQVEESID